MVNHTDKTLPKAITLPSVSSSHLVRTPAGGFLTWLQKEMTDDKIFESAQRHAEGGSSCSNLCRTSSSDGYFGKGQQRQQLGWFNRRRLVGRRFVNLRLFHLRFVDFRFVDRWLFDQRFVNLRFVG
jgi:hypothetical protein